MMLRRLDGKKFSPPELCGNLFSINVKLIAKGGYLPNVPNTDDVMTDDPRCDNSRFSFKMLPDEGWINLEVCV